MSLPREDNPKRIADQLNLLAATLKTRSRASLTDANRVLEPIAARFFNALFGWDLENLNVFHANYPAADLGDRGRRIAIQVTNEDGSDKIKHTASKAVEHQLGADFDRLIIFFLLPKKPAFPKSFVQPAGGPNIETWDIKDLLTQMLDMNNLDALARAAKVLDEEMGKIPALGTDRQFDISRILKYAPAQLIGREAETKLLKDAWAKVHKEAKKRPHVLTFVALGGEGKTALVAKWAAELAAQDWPGCEAAFAWSFYRQTTHEQVAANSELFLTEALTFFGDDADREFAAGNAAAYEKARRLARVVGRRRRLLILDGLEPLQCAPSPPAPGELKDMGIAALLKGLATDSNGLCVVTTRYSLSDLRAFWQTTAPEVKLPRLSRNAGVDLLQRLDVKGSLLRRIPSADGKGMLSEFEKLVEDVKGHALTLTLLGAFLRVAHGGDIRQRDRVEFRKADAEVQGGHAFRVMDAYVRWISSSGARGEQQVAILRTLGLFDGPADAGCLAALRRRPAICGLTEPLMAATDEDWDLALSNLEEADLLRTSVESVKPIRGYDEKTSRRHFELRKMGFAQPLGSPLDFLPPYASSSFGGRQVHMHPLIREYFGHRLREVGMAAWREGHRRLFEHLVTTVPFWPADLDGLQPLYQAVSHGCEAGMLHEAGIQVYWMRVLRCDEFWSSRKLGAMAQNLAAVACFFEKRWSRVSPAFSEGEQGVLLNEAAVYLSSLGRLQEAVEPMQIGLTKRIDQNDYGNAAISSGNLSELELALGHVASAALQAERSVRFADGSNDDYQRMLQRTSLATAMHQSGRREEALLQFREAEAIGAESPLGHPLLYSMPGYHLCDLLLDECERVVWAYSLRVSAPIYILPGVLGDVERRARMALQLVISGSGNPLDIALNRITLARTAFFEGMLVADIQAGGGRPAARDVRTLVSAGTLDHAAAGVDGLRESGHLDDLPRGLLFHAWLRFLTRARTGAESAQADLDEAWDIAERGPMRLHMADIHLYRARLFFREKSYPWESPKADLAAAEKLINECGYHRRDEELADAKKAILGQ